MPLSKSARLDQAPELATTTLLQNLSADDTSLRLEAAETLGQHPEHMLTLANHLKHEQHFPTRDAIATALMRFPSKDTAAVLFDILQQTELILSNQVADVLRHFPAEMLTGLNLINPEHSVSTQLLAIQVVADWPHQQLLDQLLPHLNVSLDVNVIAATLEVLRQTRSLRLRPVLEDVGRRFKDETYIQFLIGQIQAELES